MAIFVSWTLVVSDGYDLIVFGTVQSSLIESTGWGLTNASIGTLGSLAFVGMMLGALFGGRLGDRFGQKRTVIICTIVFTCLNALCGAVDSPVLFGVLRFLAGVGLGGLLPSSNALVAGLVAPRWRATVATIMMSGVPVGGILAALTGLVVIPTLGWRWMFFLTLVSLLIIPFALKYLPSRGPEEASARADRSNRSSLFAGPYALISALFAIAALAVLFVWFGLGIWLPRLLETQGYDLGSALTFALTLNIGAVIGSILTAWAGTRYGALAAAAVATALTGLAMVAMISDQLPIVVTYLLLIVAGIGTHGSMCLIIGAINNTYPAAIRGTALGWALGMGRLGAVLAPQAGGLLIGTAAGVAAVYGVFAGGAIFAAAVMGVLILVIRRAALSVPDDTAALAGASSAGATAANTAHTS
ncbi:MULTISPECIES: MFS transporter [Brevibacterium]|jgi:AAHS family benzoate transporter-like MFS transporter|uniref:MFS transporter n=1 Tax=Brevibacterium TaxID=1696 RepID=UPI0031D11808